MSARFFAYLFALQKVGSQSAVMGRAGFIFFVVAVLLAFISTWLSVSGVTVTRDIANASIQHELGRAYIVPVVQPHWPLVLREDSEGDPDQSRLALYENDRQLGPAHSAHDTIRLVGHGSYSLWGGQLRFSSSDDSSPLTNGRSYHARVTLFLPMRFLALGWGILLLAILLNRPVLAWGWGVPGVRWVSVNVLPGIALSVLLLAILAGAGELYLREKGEPFTSSNWPSRFDPRYGFNFVPESTVKLTNHIDFWATNHANALGFLDREPPKSPYPQDGSCRIAIVGDSFVEAAQVPIEQKIQVKLERIANENGDNPKLQAMAFGYSGTGQVNQLPFYDVFARPLHPRLVVLVFVGNDFANNSSALESIRNGWDPVYPPRLFYEKDADGGISDIPIDPNWYGKIFPEPHAAESWLTSLHRTLTGHSYLYDWAFTRTSLGYPGIARWIDGTPDWNQVYAGREREVKARWGDRFDFAGWSFPDDWDMDTMFFAESLPPVFQRALAFTGHALDEFLMRGKRDGFNLVILADKSMYLPGSSVLKTAKRSALSKTGQIDRLKALAQSRHIPVVDLYAYIKSIHQDPSRASFAHNGHWSPLGHMWAAQALYGYIHQHPESCSG